MDSRDFTALGPAGALKSGMPLPPPQGVFPRYVEAESETARA
jgi:methionyl-tRNA synthetase